jgi:hypothetical protein
LGSPSVGGHFHHRHRRRDHASVQLTKVMPDHFDDPHDFGARNTRSHRHPISGPGRTPAAGWYVARNGDTLARIYGDEPAGFPKKPTWSILSVRPAVLHP